MLIADCEDPENLSASVMQTSNDSSTTKSHRKERCCFLVQMDISNTSILLNLRAAKCPPGKTLEQDEEEKEDTCFANVENAKTSGAGMVTSYVSLSRSTSNNDDVKRQTRTSAGNASDDTR